MRTNTVGLGIAAAAFAFGLASAASAATIIPIGTFTPTEQFYLTGLSTPYTSTITANFSATITSPMSFDDIFEFTIPTQSGLGSGSLSTSSSGNNTDLTISSVSINGTPYSISDVQKGVSDIKITAGKLNMIEVVGSGAGIFSGTATFNTATVPEPATWALLIGGMGVLGATLRRRRASLSVA